MILILPSLPQISNQTLRKFEHVEREFFRISVVDDNKKPPYYVGALKNNVPGYINLILKLGISLFDMHLIFIQYSNS